MLPHYDNEIKLLLQGLFKVYVHCVYGLVAVTIMYYTHNTFLNNIIYNWAYNVLVQDKNNGDIKIPLMQFMQ